MKSSPIARNYTEILERPIRGKNHPGIDMSAAHPSKEPRPHPPSPSIARKFLYLLGARGFRETLGAVFFILLARKSTVLFGEFMLALSMGYLLRIAADFGLNQFLVPRLSRKASNAPLLLQVSLLKGALFLVVWTAGLFFLSSQAYATQLRHVMVIIAAGVGLEVFANTFFVVLQVRGRQGTEGMIKSLAAFLGFGYGIVMLAAGFSPRVVAFFKIIETIIFLVFSSGWAFKAYRARPMKPSLAGVVLILPQVLVFGLIDVFSVATAKINLFFLQHHGGSDGVGQYSAPWELVDGITLLVLELLLQSVLYPVFARLWLLERKQAAVVAREAFRWLMAAALVISAVLFMESDRLIPLIYGPGYPDAVWLQKLLVLTVALTFLQYFCSFLMMSMGQERRLLLYYGIVLLVNILLCRILIPGNPLQGSAWSIIGTKAVVALLTVSHCHVQVRLIPGRSLIQLGGVCALSAVVFFSGRGWIRRELVECFTVLPMIGLIGAWWTRGGRHHAA